MALAPSPTTVIDGVTVYAAPAKSGKPRNAFLVIGPVRSCYGETFRVEIAGGATREAAARKKASGDDIIETAAHEWIATPARHTPFAI